MTKDSMQTRTYWSSTASPTWDGALTCGDGTLGALLWGDADQHTLVLAHERVVLPADPPLQAPVLAPDLKTFRALIDGDKAQDAAELAVRRSEEQGYPGLQWTDPLVPVAAITIGNAPHATATAADYRRVVDPERGLIEIGWRRSDAARRIRAFVSRRSGFLVVQVDGSATTATDVVLGAPDNAVLNDYGVRGGNADRTAFTAESGPDSRVLTLRFTAPWSFQPLGARTATLVRPSRDGFLLLAAVDPLTATAPATPGRLADLRATPASFERLLEEHLEQVERLPAAPRLDLDAPASSLSTESLRSAVDPVRGRELIELQYRASHAAIIGSTGELPPTLQGVWSGTFDPSWSSDYTMNGNVQNGSIASLLGSGRSDLLRVYLRMLEGFSDDFAQNAAHLFGTGGFVLPSRCSPTHGRTTHFDARHCHEFWTAGGAWAAASFFDDVWHTADLGFLADHAYPFAREVERFWEDFLPDGDGPIVFSPSYSPENTSPTFRSQACRNATMDRASLWRLTTDLRRAAALLGVDQGLDRIRADRLARLPRYRVADDGTLAEWLDDDVTERIGHRTTSQVYGLWFEPEPELQGAPLSDAVRRLVAGKLAWRASSPQHEEMSYGLVQLGLAAAAVGDADGALECVERMSRFYFLPSLMTTHNVGEGFNVDISGGFPAVIHAMLLGSSMDRLTLLPALPSAWPSGSIAGLSARGGIRLTDLAWDDASASATLVGVDGAAALRGGSMHRIDAGTGWAFPDGRPSIELDLPDSVPTTVELHRSPAS